MKWRWWSRSGMMALLLVYLPAQPAVAAAPLSDAGPVLEDLARQAQDPGHPATERVQIIDTLGAWAMPEVRPSLLTVLKDPKPEIREAAARALGWPGDDEAVPALKDRIEAPDEVAAVKAAAVRSLGRIGNRSVRSLVISMTQDPDASIREAAQWSVALGGLVESADQTSYLIQLAEHRKANAQVRAEAIRVLATKPKDERIVASLSGILEHEPRLTILPPPESSTNEQIMSLRSAQARDVPAWAAGALGGLEAREALPLLLRTAEDPNDFFLRQLSVASLVTWNVPEAFPVYVKRLGDPYPNVRILALMGLQRLGDPKVVDVVVSSLSDPNLHVRAQAVTVVAALGGSKVRPQLEALEQKESEPEVRAALEAALSRLAR